MGQTHHVDLIVIGSGAGGGAGAIYAAARGHKIVLFEKGEMGGECPNIGCVPTKALLQAAEAYDTMKNASQFGITASNITVNFKKVQQWKDLAVARTGTTEGEAVFRGSGITVIRKAAKFVGPHSVKAGADTYHARRFIIATGSSVAVPPIPGLAETGFITFLEAINLPAPPKSLFIIGGGAIGCEFAQIYSTFGTKVYIADALPRLLAHEDREVGELVAALFTSRNITVATNASINSIGMSGRKKVVHYTLRGHKHTAVVDDILVATGKKPNLDLGLDKAGVKFDRHGISVNHYLQSSAPHIYAAGDVTGPYLFTHTGAYQSHLAAHNAISRKKVRVSYTAVPRCVYTRPEVASVGMNEDEARGKDANIKIGVTPLSMIGRANTSNEGDGFAKVITDRNGRLLGASIVGPRAGEMIHELAVAIRLRATAQDVASTIHAFPTFSEVVKYACNSVR